MSQATLISLHGRRITTLVFSVLLTACGGGGAATGAAGTGAQANNGNMQATGNGNMQTTGNGNMQATGSQAAPNTVLAADARFNFPDDVAIDADGNLYVADTGNYTVRKITAAGLVSTFAGSSGVKGNVDGAAAAAQFSDLKGITVDTDRNVYVLDANAVRKITQAGAVSTVAGAQAEAGYADRPGTASLFYRPLGITADASGNLYVADTGNSAIRKITPSGAVTTVLKDSQNFNQLRSIATRGTNLYIGDENCMWRIELSGGTSLTRMGGEPGVYDNVDGSTGIRFWPLNGITVDGSGNVYAAESFAYPHQLPPLGVIRKMTPSANGLEFTASTPAGKTDSTGSADGTGPAAQFNMPMGITADAGGNLYVADSNNHIIRKVTPAGVVTTIAGKAGEKGSN